MSFMVMLGLFLSFSIPQYDITCSPDDFQYMMENWQEEIIIPCSVHFDGEEPIIHLHAALGHHGDTLTACVRKNTKVYLILEVMLFELDNIDASRPWYEKGGFNRLTFS